MSTGYTLQRKEFNWPYSIAIGPSNEVAMADFNNKEVIIFDKDLKLIRTFGQGSGDSKLNDPICVAVNHNVIAVSEFRDHVVKIFSLQETTSQNLALTVVEMVNLITLKDCVTITKVYCMLWSLVTAESGV